MIYWLPTLHNPVGKNVMLLGLDVLPEYRGNGRSKEIVHRYAERERGREKLILTCLEEKVPMYERIGFSDNGIADSSCGRLRFGNVTENAVKEKHLSSCYNAVERCFFGAE